MSALVFFLVLIASNAYLSFNRMNLQSFAITNAAIFLAYLFFGSGSVLLGILMFVMTAVAVLLNLVPLRQNFLSKPAFGIFKSVLPSMSSTEKEALEAGTTWWEGELFSGKPDWNKFCLLYTSPSPRDKRQSRMPSSA